MSKLPTLLVSSVIRGSQLGESHGGLYLVDLERAVAQLKLDWNTTDIDIAGHGGDRGLRGIGFHGEHILVAANAQLLFLDQDFQVVESYANPHLQHCHELSIAGSRVFLAATGYDSVLMFDLGARRFTGAWHLGAPGGSLRLTPYDPSSSPGPPASHRFHLNSITADASGFWFSGLHTPGLLRVDTGGLRLVSRLPEGTHNAQPFHEGVVFNDTVGESVSYWRGAARIDIAVPHFAAEDIINRERFASNVARPHFARGLCVLDEGRIAGGSSPSTVAVYDLTAGRCLLQHNLSMDVRNAVHGLALWPY